MTHFVRRAALLMFTGFLLFASLPHVFAIDNETFGLTPSPERKDGVDRSAFSVPLETGATFEDAIRIYNRTDQTLNLVVYAADAEAAADSTISIVGFHASQPKGVGAWIDLSREDVELAPRSAIIVTFRIAVKSANPEPNLGAIVVEDTASSGRSSNAIQRLHLVVHTTAPNTQTTSRRVRSLLLRSPWIAIALLGLVIVGTLVWVGARRARRTEDAVVPAGGLDDEPDAAQDASRPVIKRLGVQEGADVVASRAPRSSRSRSRKRDERPLLDDALLVEDDPADDGSLDAGRLPLLDEDEDFEDFEEDDLPPAKHRPASRQRSTSASKSKKPRKTAAKKPVARSAGTKKSSGAKGKASPRKAAPKPEPKPKRKSGYIPLDDL